MGDEAFRESPLGFTSSPISTARNPNFLLLFNELRRFLSMFKTWPKSVAMLLFFSVLDFIFDLVKEVLMSVIIPYLLNEISMLVHLPVLLIT